MSLGVERPPKVYALAKIREQAKGVFMSICGYIVLPKELKAPDLEKGQLEIHLKHEPCNPDEQGTYCKTKP